MADSGGGRGGLVVAILLLVGVGAFGIRAALGPDQPELTLDEQYLLDNRVRPLIYDCGFGKQFDVQTLDMTRTLVSKLERGARDPLRRAKQELADIGEPAIPEMRRLFNEVYQDRFLHGVTENILATCSMMNGPWGLEMLRLGIRHPQESVRLVALAGLERHGTGEDYDTLFDLLPIAGSKSTRIEFGTTLAKLDPERFQEDLVGWLEVGSQQDLWEYTLQELADLEDPSLVARALEAAELRDLSLRPFLIAPAARNGNEAALDELRALASSERPGERQVAVQALALIGMVLEVPALLTDSNAGVRRNAYSQLVEHGALIPADQQEDAVGWLEEGINDPDPEIREMCLKELVSRGNTFGRSHALRMLEGHASERQVGIQVLRDAWDANPGAAEEAFARLMNQYQITADDPGARQGVLQALSQVSVQDSSDFLMDLSRQASGMVGRMDAHRWFVGQVWNTGPRGRDMLRDELSVETDPFRRLSLIEFIWQDHSPESCELLMGLVDDESIHPYERLYAADRAIRIGPASRVAPALKRAYQACTDPRLRPALQCLLWTWYGQHYD